MPSNKQSCKTCWFWASVPDCKFSTKTCLIMENRPVSHHDCHPNVSNPADYQPYVGQPCVPQQAVTQETTPHLGVPQASYPQSTYPQASYPQASFPQASYQQASYPQASYPQAHQIYVENVTPVLHSVASSHSPSYQPSQVRAFRTQYIYHFFCL